MGGALGCCRQSTAVLPVTLHPDSDDPQPTPSTHSLLLHKHASASQDTSPISPVHVSFPESSLQPPTSPSPPPPSLMSPSNTSSTSLHHRHLSRKANVKRLKEVKRTMFASVLSDSEVVRFADLFDVDVVEGGAVIFQQGAVADRFYLIKKGEVNMKFSDKETMLQQQAAAAPTLSLTLGTSRRTVAQGSGGSPPATGFMRTLKGGKSPHKRRANSLQVDADTAAVIKARSPTSALSPPSPSLNSVDENSAPSKSRGSVATSTRFFSYSSMTSKTDKADKDKERDRTPTTVVPKHASARAASTVPDQLVSPIEEKEGQTAASTLLTTKSSGEFFGLEALRFGPYHRSCVCIAAVHTELLALSSASFHSFVDGLGDKEKRKKLYDLVGDSLQACLQQMPYLSGVSAAKVSLLSSLFVWTTLPADRVLFMEGERDKKGNGLYFLYEGTVGVYCLNNDSGKSELLKELTPGVCFGELGLIIHLPRTATIRAHSNCLLLHLPHRSFHNFLHLTPEILTKFKEQIETYQLNVVYLLENELISQFFFQHCAREYSTENLEFWWEAKHFRVTAFSDEERKVEAERLMRLYITDSSPKQINLKGNTQKNILTALQPPISRKPSPANSPSSRRTPSRVDSQLYFEAENEIFNLLATDSFTRFKSSPLFRECLEEMHIRVRSSSISGGGVRVGTDGGEREGSISPSPSSSLSLRDSPEPSPKTSNIPGQWEETKEEDLTSPTSAIQRRLPRAPSSKRSSGRKQLPALSRSNTGLGTGALHPKRNALKRTATTMRTGPISAETLTPRRSAVQPGEGGDAASPSKQSPRRPQMLVLPGGEEEGQVEGEGASVLHSPSNRAAEGAPASFAVYLNSRRKAGAPTPLSPINGYTTLAPASIPPSLSALTADQFSPRSRAAAAVAARKRALHVQLVQKALSSARGSLQCEEAPDSPTAIPPVSQPRRPVAIQRVNSLRGTGST